MRFVRSAFVWLLGLALLAVLAGGVVYYGVVVPHQREDRFEPAPVPTPTASAATATSVPSPLTSR